MDGIASMEVIATSNKTRDHVARGRNSPFVIGEAVLDVTATSKRSADHVENGRKKTDEVFASRVSRSMLDARSDHKVPDGTSRAGKPRTSISPYGSRMVDPVISRRTVRDLRSNCRFHHASRSAEETRIIHGSMCRAEEV